MSDSGATYRALVNGDARGVGPFLARGVLRAISLPYGAVVRVRNRLYDAGWLKAHLAGVPVVSVGNLTLGGTGKTPCVEYVARFFRELGAGVAIVSRGYGGNGGRNDEALVLEENLPDVPHLQGPDRVALAAIAVEELETELVILDDGFQHRRLARDLDLVLLDATDPWEQGYLFPRGFLREPKASLRRADAVLLTRCDQASADTRKRVREEVRRLAPEVPWIETRHRPVELRNSAGKTALLERLQGRPVAAFCGLGNPAAFQQTLKDCGAEIRAFRAYSDHHAYTRVDVEDLREWARKVDAADLLVTTQKDLVKLRLTELGGRELWALAIRLHVELGQEALDRKLMDVWSATSRSS